jgi:hypothetical protein
MQLAVLSGILFTEQVSDLFYKSIVFALEWLLLACTIATTKQQRFPPADSKLQSLAFSYRSRSSRRKFSSSSNLKIET